MKSLSRIFFPLPFIVLLSILSSAAERDNRFPDTSTFFPLLLGSYWIYQDTFPTNESFQMAAEACNCQNPAEWKKDSVSSCVNSDSGYIATICQTRGFVDIKTKRPSNRDRKPVRFYYRCFKDKIYQYGSVWAGLIPRPGDTLPIAGPGNEKMYYKQSKDDSTIQCLVPLNEKETTLCFKKGVGLTGLVSGGVEGHNLIEYRIGNGPVIKKHWLMEAPKEK